MKDMIEFKDGDYGIAKLNRGFFSNLIKTKPSSFRMILSHWNEYRTNLMIGKLENKLEEKREDAVNTTFRYNQSGDLTNKSNSKMDNIVLGIAKLESKIKVLSREDVPSTYVKSRAIKLKKKMMDNLWYHSRRAYTVGEENYDKVFDEDTAVSSPVEPAYASATDEEVINKKDLFDVINDSFNNVEEEVNMPTKITPEVVRDTVGVPDYSDDSSEVDLPFEFDTRDTDLVSDEINNTDNIVSFSNEDNNIDDSKDLVNEESQDVNDDYSKFDESLNYKTNSSKAKMDMFDENGYRKDMFNYVPMTDEEIEQARLNIENNLNEEKENIRDESVIVPDGERESVLEKNMNEDISINNEPRSVSIDSSSFESMKASVLEMQNSIEDSERNRAAAEQDAFMASERAKEARRKYEESEQRLAEAYREYQAYCLYLKEKKEAIDNQGRALNEDASKNRDFIASQERMVEENNNLYDNITSLIPEEIRSRGR